MPEQQNFDAQLEIFEEQVREKIKQLSSKDARIRSKAAAWLGEAGDPTAITMLAQIYKNDPDPSVRESARYSLGMFRRLEQELSSGDQDRVHKLLEDVAVRGKMGRRARFSVRAMSKLAGALLISAVLVFVIALILPPILKQSSAQTPGNPDTQPTAAPLIEPTAPSVVSRDRPTLVTDLQAALVLLRNNTTKLQGQYQAVLDGGSVTCTEFFDTLTPIALTSENRTEFADLATIADEVNGVQAAFRLAKSAYDRVCVSNETLDTTAFSGPVGEIIGLEQSISGLETRLASASGGSVAEPTLEATASVDLRSHVIALQAIVDDVTAPDGPNNTLTQYWSDSQTAGGTTGCSRPVSDSDIPADYSLPADASSASDDLTLAANLINTGLKAIRQSRDTFNTACGTNTVADSAALGLQLTTSAGQAFEGAVVLLNTLR